MNQYIGVIVIAGAALVMTFLSIVLKVGSLAIGGKAAAATREVQPSNFEGFIVLGFLTVIIIVSFFLVKNSKHKEYL